MELLRTKVLNERALDVELSVGLFRKRGWRTREPRRDRREEIRKSIFAEDGEVGNRLRKGCGFQCLKSTYVSLVFSMISCDEN